jgi:hypothetical protein
MSGDASDSLFVWLGTVGNPERWQRCILPKMAKGVIVGTVAGALVDTALLGTDLGASTGIGAVAGGVWGLWKGLQTCPAPDGYAVEADVGRFVDHMRVHFDVGPDDARDLLALAFRLRASTTACSQTDPQLRTGIELLLKA